MVSIGVRVFCYSNFVKLWRSHPTLHLEIFSDFYSWFRQLVLNSPPQHAMRSLRRLFEQPYKHDQFGRNPLIYFFSGNGPWSFFQRVIALAWSTFRAPESKSTRPYKPVQDNTRPNAYVILCPVAPSLSPWTANLTRQGKKFKSFSSVFSTILTNILYYGTYSIYIQQLYKFYSTSKT